jgi:hypothetical protein
MSKERMIPISRLHASEAQTLRALGLIKDMAKVLRTAPMDGVSRLLEQAEAIENGVRTDSPNHVAMREALEQVAAYLDGLGGHEVMLGQIEAVVEGA